MSHFLLCTLQSFFQFESSHLSLLEAALTARMDLEYIQLVSCSDHQAEVNPTSVLVHVELPQFLALHSGGHLLQQIAHCLQAKAAPERKYL